MIYDHGSCSGLSFYLLEFRISIRRFTVKDGQSPGGVSKEEQVVLGVEFDVARIRRSVADCDNFACLRIDGDQFVILTCGEELMADVVDGESGWSRTRRKWPRHGDFL